jgi:hypothetical protein
LSSIGGKPVGDGHGTEAGGVEGVEDAGPAGDSIGSGARVDFGFGRTSPVTGSSVN